MSAMHTNLVNVYFEGQIVGEITEDKIMDGFPASDGCKAAGRENHSMYRQSCYHTFCIHEDCDWGF
jgi:hypothetical protein